MNVVCANDNATQDTLTFIDNSSSVTVAENPIDQDNLLESYPQNQNLSAEDSNSNELSKANTDRVLGEGSSNYSVAILGDDVYLSFYITSMEFTLPKSESHIYFVLDNDAITDAKLINVGITNTFAEDELEYTDYEIVKYYGLTVEENGVQNTFPTGFMQYAKIKCLYFKLTSLSTYSKPKVYFEIKLHFKAHKIGNYAIYMVEGKYPAYSYKPSMTISHVYNYTVDVVPAKPDMTVKKITNNVSVVNGEQASFTVFVNNTGNVPLSDVFVREESFTNGLILDSYANGTGNGWRLEGNTFYYDGVLPAGENASFDVIFNTTSAGKKINTVVAGSDKTEEITATNNTTVLQPNMTVSKITLNKTVIIGENVYFMVNVTNNGECNLNNVTVNEFYDSGKLTLVNYTGHDKWVRTGNIFKYETVLKPNESAVFTVWFKTLINGTVTNTINASSNLTGNKTAFNTTTVYRPNLTVSKLTVNRTVCVGQEVVFTVVVTNTGDCDLGDIEVSENVPEGLKYNGKFSGENWLNDGNVFSYDSVLKSGDSASFNVTFTAVDNGTWINTVNASSNLTGNKTAFNTTTVYRPNLTVSKLALNRTVYIGNQTVFTIIVTNTGDCDLGDIEVSENVPEGLRFDGKFSGENWSNDGNVFSYDSVLKPNDSASFNITFTAVDNGSWINAVNASSNLTGNKSAFNTTTVYRPNLTVSKLTVNRTVCVGQEVVFTVVVTNTGDCDLGDIEVSENVPEGLRFDGKFSGDGWSNDGNVFSYDSVLKPNDSASFNITFTAVDNNTWVNKVNVSSNLTESMNAADNVTVYRPNLTVSKLTVNRTVCVGHDVVFTVVVTNTGDCDLGDVRVTEDYPEGLEYAGKFSGENWSDDGNVFSYDSVLKPGDSASFNVTFTAVDNNTWVNKVNVSSNLTQNRTAFNTTTVYRPNMTVSKLALNRTVYVGNQTVFTIIVTNTGDCDLNDVFVVENIPEGLIYSAHVNVIGNWSKIGNRFNLDGILKPSESKAFDIVFDTVYKGNFTNAVVAGSDLTDNRTASNTTVVYKPDISVLKISLNASVYVGDLTAFTIVVRNTGDCDLSDIVVDEIFNDDELEFADYSNSNIWAKSGSSFTLNGVLKAGESSSFTVWFKTLTNGTLTNKVTVSSNVTDNKFASNNTTVYSPDLSVLKLALNRTVYLGNQTVFTVVVTNTGDCPLRGVTVLEAVPEGLSYVSFDGKNWSEEGNVFKYGDVLGVGESTSFNVVFEAVKSGNWTNTVVVKSDLTSDKSANNTTTVFAPDLEIQKTSLTPVVYVGDNVTFKITVSNTGDCPMSNFTVKDAPADGLEFESFEGDNWVRNGDVFVYTAVLNPGEEVSFFTHFKAEKPGNYSSEVVLNSNKTSVNGTVVLEREIPPSNETEMNVTVNETNTTDDNVIVICSDVDNETSEDVPVNETDIYTTEAPEIGTGYMADKYATGNPLIALLMVLMIIGVSAIRKFKF